jgi:hypothetical protein
LDPEALLEAYAAPKDLAPTSVSAGPTDPLGLWLDHALMAPVDLLLPESKACGVDGLHSGQNVVAVCPVGAVHTGDGLEPVLVRM